ncbi:hypothetical protein ACNHQB_20440, partial [Mycolicibacterium sp. A43C]
MINRVRVAGVDILAPALAILALVFIGSALDWPRWWVAVCTALCLLILQGVVVNAVLFRRDGVTVGTDDDGPLLRLGVVATATVL